MTGSKNTAIACSTKMTGLIAIGLGSAMVTAITATVASSQRSWARTAALPR